MSGNHSSRSTIPGIVRALFRDTLAVSFNSVNLGNVAAPKFSVYTFFCPKPSNLLKTLMQPFVLSFRLEAKTERLTVSANENSQDRPERFLSLTAKALPSDRTRGINHLSPDNLIHDRQRQLIDLERCIHCALGVADLFDSNQHTNRDEKTPLRIRSPIEPPWKILTFPPQNKNPP